MNIALTKQNVYICFHILRRFCVHVHWKRRRGRLKFYTGNLPLIEKAEIKPNLAKIFNPEDIRDTHKYIESNENFGKVVLKF